MPEEVKECPLCGGTMKLKETQTVTRVPGTSKTTARKGAEWVCPECDYFEEAEEGGT
jgi:YgiT-type zinc finger domain-containing protein